MANLISEVNAAVKWHLPNAFNIAWCEQNAVTVLMALLDGMDAKWPAPPAEWTGAVGGVEPDRHEAAGPVVAVDDVGRPAELEAEVEGGAAEEDEAFVVVGETAGGVRVDLGAAEEPLVFEEVGFGFGAGDDGFPHAREFRPAGEVGTCLLYTSPSPRDRTRSRMPSSA